MHFIDPSGALAVALLTLPTHLLQYQLYFTLRRHYGVQAGICYALNIKEFISSSS